MVMEPRMFLVWRQERDFLPFVGDDGGAEASDSADSMASADGRELGFEQGGSRFGDRMTMRVGGR